MDGPTTSTGEGSTEPSASNDSNTSAKPHRTRPRRRTRDQGAAAAAVSRGHRPLVSDASFDDEAVRAEEEEPGALAKICSVVADRWTNLTTFCVGILPSFTIPLTMSIALAMLSSGATATTLSGGNDGECGGDGDATDIFTWTTFLCACRILVFYAAIRTVRNMAINIWPVPRR